MNARAIALCVCMAALSGAIQGQNNAFNASRGTVGATDKDAFNRGRAGNFNDYRTSLNAEYARMIREDWGGFNSFRGLELPDRNVKPVPPKPYSENDGGSVRDDRKIVIEEVVSPIKDRGGVAPVAPVKADPDEPADAFTFSYLGTQMKVRVPSGASFRLSGVSEGAIADAWTTLSQPAYAAMVADCIALKSKHRLCDWAYLNMLDAFSRAWCGSGNSATLVMAYVYSQSGYKIRLAEADGKLDMLYASRHKLYTQPYFTIDGEMFYTFRLTGGSANICGARFAREQSLSLWVPSSPEVALTAAPDRTITSKRYNGFSATVSVNRNLIDFYNSYPTSEVGTNFCTRWAMYANTPTSNHVRQRLYPQLKSLISGLTQLEATERLLNWVQTGLVYEYDDKVWGHDRAFFPEESLYYPYADCEDRSILFTRLVRDLLGLPCLLIYYPGHLAAAVNFTDKVSGDYIEYGGRRFTVTDPTYIGAPVGRTMPGMDNSQAKVIVLE